MVKTLIPFPAEQSVQCVPGENSTVYRERNVDGTSARVNSSNCNVIVCSNGAATMYFAREHKGHAGVSETPVETFGGILIHDHEACFYSYGTDHQECMVHIERYLKDSIENEKSLTWNKQMLELIKEMIHANNIAPAEGIAAEKIAAFETRYDAIVRTAAKEYEDDPPSDYYRDRYNLYLRMVEYKHNHLLFLSNPLAEPDNNLCERKACFYIAGPDSPARSFLRAGNPQACSMLLFSSHLPITITP